jgi:hypothetical protein
MHARFPLEAESLCLLLIAMTLLGCVGARTQAKAVYLVALSGGLLSASDLKAHPEVVVVNSQRELASQAKTQVAIWIDKNATKLVDLNWLQTEPQNHYPIFLIGYNDALYSFREQLPAFMISGPYVDWSQKQLEPGFSVWKLTAQTSSSTEAYMRGYATSPTVERVLLVTDALLQGGPPPDAVP